MEKKNTQNRSGNATAGPPERTLLITVPQRSVLLGITYAALLCGLTMLMDKIPVPSKDSTLWVLMAGFYISLVVISIFLEKIIAKKTEFKRTLYYVAAQLAILAVIVVLVASGTSQSSRGQDSDININAVTNVNADKAEEYFNSEKLSFAMAFAFMEFVLFLYHLGRMVVLHIRRSSEEQGAKQKKNKKNGKP